MIIDVPVSPAGRDGVARARAMLGDRQDPHAPIELRRQALVAFAEAAGQPSGVELVEDRIGGVRVDRITPPNAAGRLLYLHGGAYVLGSARTHRSLAAEFARRAGASALAVDYRLAPEHPFPAARDDVLAIWEAIAQPEIPTVWIGDSAGGGLALASIIAARDAGMPMPAALILLSPWIDLTLSGESHRRRADVEAMLTTEGLAIDALHYCGGRDPADPQLSPLFGRLEGLPPMLIQVGDNEILLDDAQRLHAALTAVDGIVTLERWQAMIHAWHAFRSMIPEGDAAITAIGDFARRHLSEVSAKDESVSGNRSTTT